MEKDELKLVKPTLEYKEQVMEYRKVFLENKENLSGCAELEDVSSYEDWIDFERRRSQIYGKDYVSSTVCLCIRVKDNKLVGIIDFRHDLTEFLLNYGGNIGYSIHPEERRKGYGTEMLRLMLIKCKEYGKKRVLITCDKENIASAKIMLANGARLENEVADDCKISWSGVIQRYWIEL